MIDLEKPDFVIKNSENLKRYRFYKSEDCFYFCIFDSNNNPFSTVCIDSDITYIKQNNEYICFYQRYNNKPIEIWVSNSIDEVYTQLIVMFMELSSKKIKINDIASS